MAAAHRFAVERLCGSNALLLAVADDLHNEALMVEQLKKASAVRTLGFELRYLNNLMGDEVSSSHPAHLAPQLAAEAENAAHSVPSMILPPQ